MELSNLTARQMFEKLAANPRKRYGFGTRPMLINVDMQCAYTQPGTYVTAYETDPRQIEYTNRLASYVRAMGLPVIWTYVAFSPSGDDCGVFGTRGDDPDALKMIKIGSDRAAIDPRAEIGPEDVLLNKKMPSAFFETHVDSLARFHKIDTVIVTGGSTSGCVRATVVDALSRSFRTIVPIECVADLHESPHFANLYDMHKKYADCIAVQEVFDWLETLA
ncbi:isochorismatase family protein [Frigidibacter sp. MR17.14]|uniref:isochorismatase family protein n=1 Tax=Frigidibacter sp. MR17.14 TaxID=3126509 RepID=UPI003012C521